MAKWIALLRVDEIAAAIDFYTRTLDFELDGYVGHPDLGAVLRRGEAELMLTSLASDQVARINIYLTVEDIDSIFEQWTARGLDQSQLTDSPVHLSPTDQTWGTRELYVTDPSGNTVRVVQRPSRS